MSARQVNDEDIYNIRLAYHNGLTGRGPKITQEELGQKYGITQARVSEFIRGEAATHVGGPLHNHADEYDRVAEMESMINEYYQNTRMTFQQIADELGLSFGQVKNVVDKNPNKRRPHLEAEVTQKAIRLLTTTRKSQRQIARELGISPSTVNRLNARYCAGQK